MAADIMGVSQAYVGNALRIQEADLSLSEQVRRGRVRLQSAGTWL